MIKLDFELVPEVTWYKNLRYYLLDSEWEKIKKVIKENNKGICEICGRKGLLHAHETWEYDDNKQIQRLKSIRGLCKDCHKVKHIGFESVSGNIDLAREWYCKINEVSKEEELINENKAFLLWEERSKKNWEIEIDINIIKGLIGDVPIFIGMNYNGRYYVKSKYEDREEVKKLGAKWDNNVKAWYYTNCLDRGKFLKWLN